MTWDEFAQTVRAGWLIVVLGCFAGLGAGLLGAHLSPVKYDAHASCIINVKTSGSVTELQLADQFAKSRARSYADIAESDRVLSAVGRVLNLATPLTGRVATEISPDTSIIGITVTDGDPQRAALTANEIVSQTSATVRSLDGGRTGTVDILMLTPATAPAAPSQPQRTIWTGVGFGAGSILGFVLAAFSERRRARNARLTRVVSDESRAGTGLRDEVQSQRDSVPTRP